MYNDPKGPRINSLKVIILMVIAVLVIMGATFALNGGNQSSDPVENDSEDMDSSDMVSVQSTLIGNNSNGSVIKYSTYGSSSSDMKVALIIGIDENNTKAESVLPTLEGADNLKYSYDVYLVNATSSDVQEDNETVDNSTNSNNTTNSTNSTVSSNNASESLAKEFVVPDIVNNNYNFTAEIHSSSDDSYIFVPSNDTYTSKEVVKSIANATGVEMYTPSKYAFAKAASIPLIESDLPSMVYMSSQYYSNSSSDEILSVISAIDNFDFEALYAQSDADNSTVNNTTTNNTTTSTVTNEIKDNSSNVTNTSTSRN